jgi:hypothetical protein
MGWHGTSSLGKEVRAIMKIKTGTRAGEGAELIGG